MPKNFSIGENLSPRVYPGDLETGDVSERALPDVRVAEELSGEGSRQVEVKPLKAYNLDYEPLGKKNKARANATAEAALNEVNDLVRRFNADFPAAQYVPDYEAFPKPEAFLQFPKKERLGLWESAVKEWREDCKQDMEIRRNAALTDLATRFEMKIDRNLIAMCNKFGITMQMMQDMFAQVEGDMVKFNQQINEAIARARNAVIGTVRDEGAMTRGAVYSDGDYTRDVVYQDGDHTRQTVRNESHQTRVAVDQAERSVNHNINAKKAEQDQMANLRKEIGIAIGNNYTVVAAIVKADLRFRENYRIDIMNFGEDELRNVINNMSLQDLQEVRSKIPGILIR